MPLSSFKEVATEWRANGTVSTRLHCMCIIQNLKSNGGNENLSHEAVVFSYAELDLDQEDFEGDDILELYCSFSALFEAIRKNEDVVEIGIQLSLMRHLPYDLQSMLFSSLETLPNLEKLYLWEYDEAQDEENNMISIKFPIERLTYLIYNLPYFGQMSHLELFDCDISEDRQDFRTFCCYLQDFEEISLSNISIPSQEMKTFMESLSEVPRWTMRLIQDHENTTLNLAVDMLKLDSSKVEELRVGYRLYQSIPRLPHQAMVSLTSALAQNSKLQVLELIEMDIEDDVGIVLANALNSLNIKKLSLCKNKITPGFINHLATALAKDQSIEVLQLNENESICDDGGIALAEALRQNSTLNILSLCSSQIGDQTCKELAVSLKHNSALKELNLCECGNVSEEGFDAFVRVSEENFVIQELKFSVPSFESQKLDFYLWLNKDGNRAKFLRNKEPISREEYIDNMIRSRRFKCANDIGRNKKKKGEIVNDLYGLSASYHWILSNPSCLPSGGLSVPAHGRKNEINSTASDDSATTTSRCSASDHSATTKSRSSASDDSARPTTKSRNSTSDNSATTKSRNSKTSNKWKCCFGLW